MTPRYVIRRLVQAVGVVFLTLILVFFTTHILGDPVRAVLPPNATQPQLDAARERLNLNRPLIAQFFSFIRDASHGSFGDSFWQRRPALPLVLDRIPATLYLSVAALVLIIPTALLAGAAAAFRPDSLVDRVVNFLSFVSISVVDFWLALMLILTFSITLRWFPTSGYGGLHYVVLPAITLALLQVGSLAQVTRAAVLEQLQQPYVDAAFARGIPRRRVLLVHALRNALISIVTVVGGILASLLNGAIIAEVVFGWPGVGLLLIQAIENRDLPLIEATVFVSAIVITLVNLVVDFTYHLINPRVRFS